MTPLATKVRRKTCAKVELINERQNFEDKRKR